MNYSKNTKLEIMYNDKDIIVVHKPCGLLSVSYPGFNGKTALSILTEICRKRGIYSARTQPKAVHRLDKDTSGVMIFALNQKNQEKIMNNWQQMVTERTYIALCHNKINPESIAKQGTINAPVAFNKYNKTYVPQNTKTEKNKMVSAVTHYQLISYNKKYSLFKLELETGRKNQIRSHLAFLGFPIIGDTDRNNSKENPINRLGLHAKTIAFTHPTTKQEMKFEVKEPEIWLQLAK